MDILHLIDQLEALLNEGSHPPLMGKKVLIDEQRAWEVIDQMRVSIPEEVKKAKRINQERDRIIAQANEEGTRIVELAKDEAQQLASETEIAHQAQSRANTIVERAQREADALKADADDYTVQVLGKLEEDLAKALSIVRNGLLKLNTEKDYGDSDS
jgi:vacuolar-type H+-ATPase subunit H